jgi:predicted NAD/FAD-dependent oxidoreductase
VGPLDLDVAVIAVCDEPLSLDLDGAFVSDSPLSWVARNNSKPGRDEVETWVLHTSPEWSRVHLGVENESATSALWDAFREATAAPLPDPAHLISVSGLRRTLPGRSASARRPR